MGLNVYAMDKYAVLEMAYSALNRDLAPVMDFGRLLIQAAHKQYPLQGGYRR